MSSLPVIAQTAGPGAARVAARRRKVKAAGTNRRPGWVTYLILGTVLLISAYPIYYTFLLASSDQVTISQHPIPDLIPDGLLMDNVQRVLNSDIPLVKGVVNSFIVALVQVAAVVMFSTLAGYSFAKLRFRGRKPLLVFVVATMAIPTQLGVVPLFIVMRDIGWSGHLAAVIVPGIVTAFGVFWMTQFLENALPYELIEAARVDGASMIRTFWHVAMPAARPAAAMLALFTFIGSWTNYFWPSIILNNQNPTLPMVVRQLQSSYFQDYSLIMAGVLLSTLPLLVVFVFAGKQLVSGIMAGAVKG
ncbi:sugar ABC transporter permease [Flavimobilis marinus]|uniref:Cellobiose ABC transporter membrane protein n=1 Tax=Flavimobilis marinus TaxID=285351 RepID=A0A1I2HD71_9MICO|nr:carbohydrate ABC transporter permease [Flavimobilis marinus]GHG57832.1 sugar ABC transporter permease [Flavimobilis marinus]SFF28124.1 cellobiose ABC transporter membrane protein [Flavimobilis marinus]